MQTFTLPYSGAQVERAIDCILNNHSATLDDYIVLIADFSVIQDYTIVDGGCNSANGTMISA